ncbi:ankyrin repeat domain-containing protein [Rhizobium sp. T1470]|uniref:ankyrin repeat domain-containing protein n=1 Tax=unclassified Rhizobium TaxID=2613769 RepID=UPI001AAF4CAF|nr:ankyrin repeat domain-containing protein [Rhizobium sp. T1473]MCA0800433.1 ankyrin repeat domain-containing protein [Rhizobium sp. T1473]
MTSEADDPQRALLHRQFLQAVDYGDIAKVREFLKDKRLDINHADPRDGFTALHLAAARNAVAVLKLLLSTGRCDVSRLDHQERTAATVAFVLANNAAVARYLRRLQHGSGRRISANAKGNARPGTLEIEG